MPRSDRHVDSSNLILALFHEQAGERELHTVNDRLHLFFHPVMTRECKATDFEDEPLTTDFPITRPDRFLPRRVNLDYRGGQWHGTYML